MANFTGKKLLTYGDSLSQGDVWHNIVANAMGMLWSRDENNNGVGFVTMDDSKFQPTSAGLTKTSTVLYVKNNVPQYSYLDSNNKEWRQCLPTAVGGSGFRAYKIESFYIRALDAKRYQGDVIFIWPNGNDKLDVWKSAGNTGTTPAEVVANEVPYRGKALQTGTSALQSFKGMVENLQEDLPNAQIIIVTLLKCAMGVGQVVNGTVRFPTQQSANDWQMANKYPIVQYTEAVANFYGLPVLNLWEDSGITFDNALPYYQSLTSDATQVHPNTTGNQLIGNVMVNFLQNLGEQEVIPTTRSEFIQTYNATAGQNLIKDSKFRRKANWSTGSLAEGSAYNINKRLNGALFLCAASWENKPITSVQNFNLVVGRRYYFKVKIRTKGITLKDPLLSGGASFNFTNTDYNRTTVRVIGNTGLTEYSVNFLATGTTSKLTFEMVNTHIATDNSDGAWFEEPILSENPITSFAYNSQAEVLLEAKYKYPLNADYGLPESLPQRNYTLSEPRSYFGQNNIIIEGLHFKDVHATKNASLHIQNCNNVIVRRCKFDTITSLNSIKALSFTEGDNCLIEECEFADNKGGINAQGASNVRVVRNHILNVRGKLDGGTGLYPAIQFNNVTGGNSAIMDNSIENIEGENDVEDFISVFNSKGTPESHIKVTGNWLRGGSLSLSGAGIVAGDYGGKYITVENNILVNTGSNGISSGAGQHLYFRDNKSYGTARANSRSAHVMWNWDYINNPTPENATDDFIMLNNKANWYGSDDKLSINNIHSHIRENMPNWDTDAGILDSDIDERILPPNLFVRFTDEPVVPNKQITSIPSIHDVIVPYGTSLNGVPRPTSVMATLDDSSTVNIGIEWLSSTPIYNGNIPGVYIANGVYNIPSNIDNPGNLTPSMKVTVLPEVVIPNKVVTNISQLDDITVAYNTSLTAIIRPTSVNITLDDNSVVNVGIIWGNTTPSYNKIQAGQYISKGTLILPDKIDNPDNIRPELIITVEAKVIVPNIIESVNPIPSRRVMYGTPLGQLFLPDKVFATLTDGSKQEFNVLWESDGGVYNKNIPFDYIFRGSLQMKVGITNPLNKVAYITVTVDKEIIVPPSPPNTETIYTQQIRIGKVIITVDFEKESPS